MNPLTCHASLLSWKLPLQPQPTRGVAAEDGALLVVGEGKAEDVLDIGPRVSEAPVAPEGDAVGAEAAEEVDELLVVEVGGVGRGGDDAAAVEVDVGALLGEGDR